jgi:hypothetical protein
MTTECDLTELDRLLAAATPGCWKAYQYAGDQHGQWMVDGNINRIDESLIVCGNLGPPANRYSKANAQFIAKAKNDLPTLLARLRAAEAVIDRYRRDVGQLVEERTAAEARVAAAETEIKTLGMAIDGVRAVYEQRIAALEAAGRAVTGFFIRTERDGTTICLTSGCHGINRHSEDCPVGAQAALLDGEV